MIECIPNFSEGRRPEVVRAIAQAIAAVPGVYVLDTHIDADHNRSVITFAGHAEPVAEAAFRAVEAAALLIDMDKHVGQHPRIGATDVLPFVPLRDATIAQCVELARAVGKRIAAMLDIPVYLYGAAASRPERRELPALRAGQYEGLRNAIRHDPERAPDFGPKSLGPAGATVVGARAPLIAYNLFLNTDKLEIAQRIARAVRGSSGGLRGVRALGMLVDGRAQVSMNLIDYRRTPAHRAVAMVAREAAAYGVNITTGELVGLIPEDALIDAGRVTLRLPQLGDAQILERRLDQAIEEANERRYNKVLRARSNGAWASATANSTNGQQDEIGAPPSSVSPLNALWSYSIHALASAVSELAEVRPRDRVSAMLRVLGREILELAQDERSENIELRIQTLLLIARRAIKATETLLFVTPADPLATNTTTVTVVNLAYTVATTARLRALEMLPQLDLHLREPIAREFAAYADSARELLQKFDPVA